MSTFILLDPTNHMYRVAEVALEAGHDLIAVVTAEPFALGRDIPVKAAFSKTVEVAGWDDVEAVVEAVSRATALDGVAGTYAGVEITLAAEAALRRAVGLPSNEPAALALSMNKERMRTALRETGLTDLGSVPVERVIQSGVWPFEGAAYVKPAQGGGSTGVRRCERLADLQDTLRDSEASVGAARPLIATHASGGVTVLEEAAPGQILSLETLSFGGAHHPIGLTLQYKQDRNPVVALGAAFPFRTVHEDRIVERVTKALTAMGLTHGAAHTELALSNEGRVEIIEINPRFVGADVIEVINASARSKIEDQLYRLSVGRAPDLSAWAGELSYSCLRYLLPPEGAGRFEALDLDHESADWFKMWREPGYAIEGTAEMKDFVCAFAVTADTPEGAEARMDAVVNVACINGRSLRDDANNHPQSSCFT